MRITRSRTSCRLVAERRSSGSWGPCACRCRTRERGGSTEAAAFGAQRGVSASARRRRARRCRGGARSGAPPEGAGGGGPAVVLRGTGAPGVSARRGAGAMRRDGSPRAATRSIARSTGMWDAGLLSTPRNSPADGLGARTLVSSPSVGPALCAAHRRRRRQRRLACRLARQLTNRAAEEPSTAEMMAMTSRPSPSRSVVVLHLASNSTTRAPSRRAPRRVRVAGRGEWRVGAGGRSSFASTPAVGVVDRSSGLLASWLG